MEKIVSFEPAHHKGVVDGKDYGIGAVRIRFVLRGKLGAVQLLLGTDWYLPADQQGTAVQRLRDIMGVQPNGWDIGYHSPVPMFEDQKPISESCEYMDGKPCYYDGSSLAAEELRDRLLSEGDAGVWASLLDYYVRTFGEELA